jgi:hypothetical protein
MAGIVEVVHDRKGQAMAIGEPFDGRPRRPRDGLDDGGLGLAVRLAPDVGREGRGIV